jgi:predicted ATPase
MRISSIKIEKFKGIQSLDIDLNDITILIGGNNSGKSSFLQGIHFAITTLQSAKMAGVAGPATTLGADQFLYKPADDPTRLNHRGAMTQTSGPKFSFTYTSNAASDPAIFDLGLRRGKNANISLTYEQNDPFFTIASERKKPLSIFVPGLAGVALREERRAEAILTTGIAQGDSNLYLRNVLLRIMQTKEKLDKFHITLNSIFPGLRIASDYDEYRHQYIPISVNIDHTTIPLEMVGTGCLQAIQLVAYATMYDPGLLLLDEPDSHLHPSNQRQLAETLLAITQQLGTKVILSTHSRHVFDALGRFDECQVVWLKKGQKQDVSDLSDLSLLLDLGALDSYELIGSPKNKVVVLSEDSKFARLQFLLEANGFKRGEYVIQPFHGVDNIKSAVPVAEFFTKLGSNTHVLIHRDGDGLLDEEKAWLTARYKSQLPERTQLFITPLTDVEHQFCKPSHVSQVYEIDMPAAEAIVNGIVSRLNAKLSVQFAQKRRELKDKILRPKEDAPSAEKLVGEEPLKFEFARGKTLFGQLLPALTAASFNPAKLTTSATDALAIPELATFAAQAWPNSQPPADTVHSDAAGREPEDAATLAAS